MKLNEYQEKAMRTCMPSCANFSYMMLNLVGEVGEFASKIGKAIRKEQLCIGNKVCSNILAIGPDAFQAYMRHVLDEELKKEAGDILWQLSGLCEIMGWTLEDVARENLAKLASRKKRGMIDGSGDNR